MISIAGKTIEESKTFDKEYYKGYIDVCTISKGIIGNVIIRWIADVLKDYSNYRFECPKTQGFLYLCNFPMISDSYFPKFLFMEPTSWELSVTLKAKVERVRSNVVIVSAKLYGRIAT